MFSLSMKVDDLSQHDNVLLRSGCHAERSRSMTGDDIQ